MAKKPAAVPSLFTKAKEQKVASPVKPKGTVIVLPKDLDAEGNLTGQSEELNKSVTDVIEADREEKAAKSKGNLAKGILNRFIASEYAGLYANRGVVPATPVQVVNHRGESLTYVTQDKSQQNGLAPSPSRCSKPSSVPKEPPRSSPPRRRTASTPKRWPNRHAARKPLAESRLRRSSSTSSAKPSWKTRV